MDDPFTLVDTWDVTFAGHGGDPIRGWYLRPAGIEADLPVVVRYIGYGGGRGLPSEHLAWPSAGYAHLVMDTRGQGSGWGSGGDTGDTAGSGPASSGVMTRGITDPTTYYFTRLFTDAARAVDTARVLPGTDGRVAVCGGSQGGALSLAAGSLVPDVEAVIADVPFLCNIRRAIDITDNDPYQEIVRYLAVHRDQEPTIERTLAHIDLMNLVPRATAPALFSTALRDMTCPPSTVFSAYNHYADHAEDKPATQIEVYPYNGHEGGGGPQADLQIRWLREIL
jgi:cephalosporin-C deacetylase